MTTVTKTQATIDNLERVGSHWVNVKYDHPHGYRDASEELYPVFTGTWRGRPVRLKMCARRYRSGDSDTWANPQRSDGWQVYTSEAWSVGDDPEATKWNGPALTETARHRLGDVARPLVLAWLDSPAYSQGRSEAIRCAVVRQLRDDASSMAGTPASRHTREVLGSDSIKRALTASSREQLMRACDALDKLADLLRN